jgi:hypothetical protein
LLHVWDLHPVVPVYSKQRKSLTLYPLGLTLDRSTVTRPDAQVQGVVAV